MNAKLTDEQRQAVCQRYQAGESMPRLAAAFGVGVGVIDRALFQAGVRSRSARAAAALVRDAAKPCRECGDGCHPNAVRPLCPACAPRFCQSCGGALPAGWRSQCCSACRYAARYWNQAPRLCRVCGKHGASRSQRTLCSEHIRQFCRTCEEPLPAGRVNVQCTACEGADKARLYAKPGRVCTLCHARVVTVRASWCSECLAETYRLMRRALQQVSRPCADCGHAMPKGRQRNYCRACSRRRDQARVKARHRRETLRCRMCGEELGRNRESYCKDCRGMLRKWRKAYHAGNPVARRLGTVRPQRRWQEEEA